MTALFNALRDLKNTKEAAIPVAKFPNVSASEIAYKEMRSTLGDGPAIAPPAEPEFWVNLAKTAKANDNWEKLARHELKNIGLCLWHGDTPLAADEALFTAFLYACKNKLRKSLCRGLIWVYLYHFPIDGQPSNKPGITTLGDWLSTHIQEWDWNWVDRHQSLKLFSHAHAPGLMSEAILSINQSIPTVLDSCGLGGTLQSGGMSYAAFQKATEKLSKTSASVPESELRTLVDRVLDWAVLDGDKFAFPLARSKLIESLLLPWSSRKPQAAIKDRTQSFLIKQFEDPRISRASWKGVNDNAMRVIYSWLVERSLSQFLDVVDKLALKHQWKYRRAFWMSYYKKNVISDAWVAFATSGAAKARQISQQQNDVTWLSFGRIQNERDQNHAVLILKIGDITIADFSHNGKCRIWYKNNHQAPKPYEKFYEQDKLMYGGADFECPHSHPQGSWQRTVETEIRNKTGIYMNPTEYMP